MAALVAVTLLSGGTWAWWNSRSSESAPPTYGYRVVNAYPHDRNAFTQGLHFEGGHLLESTGMHGESSLREVDVETGKVKRSVALDRRYFGEGITVHGGRIYQLTWKSGVCFVYDAATFRHLGSFRYDGEGWGITSDGTRLFVSNGSSALQILDAATFKPLGKLRVRSAGRPVRNLNELEFVGGEIWANIWGRDAVARISPETGDVTAWIDFSGLYSRRQRLLDRADVFNGIAHDPQTGRLFVTGKNWPKLFEVEIIENGE